MKAVTGRAVVARQRDFAFYRPSAVVLARVITDFPVLIVEVVVFGIIMYFMTGLALDPAKFFIYLRECSLPSPWDPINCRVVYTARYLFKSFNPRFNNSDHD